MRNKPAESELAELCEIPIAENTPLEERVIHMHFFLGNSDWYVSAYDPQRRMFSGYVIPNNDYEKAGWGQFSLEELDRLRSDPHGEVVRNLDWKPTRAMDVDRIRDAHGWTKGADRY